jgi:hypothetical protein
MRIICPAHLILLDFITLIIFDTIADLIVDGCDLGHESHDVTIIICSLYALWAETAGLEPSRVYKNCDTFARRFHSNKKIL